MQFKYDNPNPINVMINSINIGQTIDLENGNTIRCIHKTKDDKYIFSFDNILKNCSINNIDDYLKEHFGDTSILPTIWWRAVKSWFIPSEFEVFGNWIYGKGEKMEQFEWYKERVNRIKYNKDEAAAYWWLRSPFYSGANYFCSVNTDGSATIDNANGSSGLAAAFLV